MSHERKPQKPDDEAREEKQTMDQPQEEFVADQTRPSKDISQASPSERARAEAAQKE